MTTDTIAAIATAPGAGGIGIVRVSGPGALPILEKLFAPARKGDYKPWTLRRGRVQDTEGNTLDDSLAVFMPGPKTFTGEDVAELQCHGGPVLLAAVLEACLRAGARLAERGEFTRRAFLNGRMDLMQAEAVAEMIAAPSKEGARLAAAKLDGVLGQRIGDLRERVEHLRAQICLAVDFPEEEVECLPLRHRGREGGGGLPARRIRADPLLARRRDRSPRRTGQRGQVQPHERPPWPPACRCDGIPRNHT